MIVFDELSIRIGRATIALHSYYQNVNNMNFGMNMNIDRLPEHTHRLMGNAVAEEQTEKSRGT